MKYNYLFRQTPVWSLVLLLVAGFALSDLQAQYCLGPINNANDEWITNVTFADVNNSTAFGQNTDNSINATATVNPGENVDFSVEVTTDGGPWSELIVIYFDFDNDFIFETELDLGSNSIDNSSAIYDASTAPGGSNTVTMPSTPGTYRMRVVLDFFGPVPGPCDSDNSSSFKDSEDYEIVVGGGGGGPTCSDGVQNGNETGVDCGGPDCAPCAVGCQDNAVTLTLTTDNFASETSWSLLDDNGGTIASISQGDYSSATTNVEEFCLPDGCYEFTIFDSFSDGICCSFGQGSYTLENANEVFVTGGEFEGSETTSFCVGDLCDIAITGSSSTPETCPGDSDGTISVSASCTSCSGIEYSIGGAFQGSSTFTGLAAGSYTVTARDTGDPSCTATTTVSVGAGTGGAILAPWSPYDVGSSGTLGNDFSQNPCDGNGTFTIDAGGNNGITSTTDAVGFIGQTICGDGSITVKIESVSQYGQGGPMIRESGAAGAKQASLFGDLTSILRWEHRAFTNGPKTVQAYTRPNPFWLRLVRQGDWVFGYYSATGTTFSNVHAAYVPMGNCVQIGMASFTSVPFAQGTTVFSNVTVTGGTLALEAPENWATSSVTNVEKATLFPNPAQDLVTVDFGSGVEVETQMVLRNKLGQQVRQLFVEPGLYRQELNVGDLTSGMYIIELHREGQPVEVLRFVKQ